MDPTRPQPYVLIQNGHPPPMYIQNPTQNGNRQVNGSIGGPYPLRNRMRAPSVHDAVPFSPFTSIVPFTPDILPFPSPASSTPSSLHTTPQDAQKGRKLIEKLSAEASNPQRTSQLLDQSLRELQRLLQADEITQYRFPTPPRESRAMSVAAAANPATPTRQAKLSAFAKMAMDRTDISYRYPTPVSPGGPGREKPQKIRSTGSVRKQEAKRETIVKNEPQAPAQETMMRNQANATLNRGYPQQYVRPSQVMGPAIVEIPAIKPSQRIHYKDVPEIETRIANQQADVAKKRKRDDFDGPVSISVSYDQSEKANAALGAFEELLETLFEAEEKYETDAASAPLTFSLDVTGPNEAPFLTKPAINRLDSAIQKVSSANCTGEVALEDLTRLQRLLDGTISGVESFNLTLGEDNSETDIEEWLQRIDHAEIGLLSARALLRIMIAGREEKQLYSEDYLNAVVRAVEHVLDTVIIPAVEARNSASGDENFKAYAAQKKSLTSLLLTAGKVLRLFGNLIAKVDVAESAVTKVEYISTRLIFVENATSEKDSCLGIQRFETLRRTAMDVLAQVFQRYPEQRTSIIDEILVSLEKLPSTRQSARQFKLPEGKPIQLVSALLMRLVQSSAGNVANTKHRHIREQQNGVEDSEDEDDEGSGSDVPSARKRTASASTSGDDEAGVNDRKVSRLRASVTPLYDGASKNASYMIQFLVQRALKSTKSGDTPYRNLLDIFTEDFLNVLGMPEWPAAEMLLRALLSKMVSITNDEKSPVPSKNFALDLLGLMGSGISDLQLFLQTASRSIDASQSEVAQGLAGMLRSDDGVGDLELIDLKGPYRMVVEYLSPQASKDPQIQSALAFLTTQWAKNALAVIDNEPAEQLQNRLPHVLRKTIADYTWLQTEYNFPSVSSYEARLASALVASSSPFCRFQAQILQRLLVFMTSSHATLMNRSLKSVNQLIDKDPSIVARSDDVLKQILFCTDAGSSLVRDSALSLLAKCLVHRPSLEKQVYRRVLARVADEAVLVRKRAMRTLKDMYTRNDSAEMKSDIASMLLTRMKDPDESVSDLAQQIFEELWMVPFYDSAKKDPVKRQLALQRHVTLFVRTVRTGVFPQAELENFLRSVLSPSAKNSAANYTVCRDMVAAMMDAIVDNEESPEKPTQSHLADSLSVFAKIQPKLFTNDQVKLLATYLRNLSTENLPMFRTVVVIYTHVLPTISKTVDHDFLAGVQGDLTKSLTRLQKSELQVTAECLWIVTGILNSRDRLLHLLLGVLTKIQAHHSVSLADETQAKAADQVRRFIHLAGAFGSACSFDAQADAIRVKFPDWKGSSVAGLIVDLVGLFTRQKQPQLVREAALECIATISQAWPQLYLRADVSKAFELVFVNDEERLECIVLNGFQQFFAKAEHRSETGADIKVGEGAAQGQQRLATSYAATDQDGAAAAISQKLLPQFIRVALEKGDELALCATEAIASVYRQGLVHPKICVPAFVALEMSPNLQVAAIAFEEHRRLHHAHETMIEKEYMDAVRQAYKFQKVVLQDAGGLTVRKSADGQLDAKSAIRLPKLKSLFAVMNSGSAKVRKRFLTNLCKEMDFELSSLDTAGETLERVIFTRFILENIALFEYERIDDVFAVVIALQKLVTEGVGVSVAQAIEEEVLNVRIEAATSQTLLDLVEGAAEGTMDIFQSAEPAPQTDIDPTRLRQLTVAAMILTMIWETRTHLRQLWGLEKKMNQKNAAKDPKKAITKTAGITSDRLLDDISTITSTALFDDASQRSLCQRFVEIVNVDREHRAISEEDDLEGVADLFATNKADGYETPGEEGSRSGGSQPPSTSGKGRKRKGSDGPGTPSLKRRKSGTPRKARGGGLKRQSTSRRSYDDDDDDEGGWD